MNTEPMANPFFLSSFHLRSRFFGFVARVPGGSGSNQCHLFAELDQPAAVIVAYVNKIVFNVPAVVGSS